MMTETDELSTTMSKALTYMQANGGKLVRYPGGYWSKAEWRRWVDPHFGTPTVEALVKRGAAEYTAWQDGRNGRFPIEATAQAAPSGAGEAGERGEE